MMRSFHLAHRCGGSIRRFPLSETSANSREVRMEVPRGPRAVSGSAATPSINRSFSAAIRFSNSDAGSSFGSCGTSLPRTARSRMKRRNRAIASGASAMRS